MPIPDGTPITPADEFLKGLFGDREVLDIPGVIEQLVVCPGQLQALT